MLTTLDQNSCADKTIDTSLLTGIVAVLAKQVLVLTKQVPFLAEQVSVLKEHVQFLENKSQFLQNKSQFSQNKSQFSKNKSQFSQNKARFSQNKARFSQNKAQNKAQTVLTEQLDTKSRTAKNNYSIMIRRSNKFPLQLPIKAAKTLIISVFLQFSCFPSPFETVKEEAI